jgi:hypothetical protein
MFHALHNGRYMTSDRLFPGVFYEYDFGKDGEIEFEMVDIPKKRANFNLVWDRRRMIK